MPSNVAARAECGQSCYPKPLSHNMRWESATPASDDDSSSQSPAAATDTSEDIIWGLQQEYNIYFFLKKRISLLQTPLWAKSKSTARRNNDISPLDGTLISEKAGGLAFTPADAGWQRALWWRRWKISTLGHSHIEIENKLQTASDVKSRGTSRNHQSGSNFGLFFFG